MTVALKYKFKDLDIKTVPGDKQIDIISYLVDSNNMPFTTSSGLDTFTVSFQASSLPTSGFEQLLTHLVNGYIRDKYNISMSGQYVKDSKIVTNISSTASIVPGQSINSSVFPAGSYVESVRDQNSFRASAAATLSGTAALTIGVKNWVVDLSEINTIIGIVNFALL